MMRNIYTNSTDIPAQIGATQNVTEANSRDILLANGWRDDVPVPPIADGMERMSILWAEGDGERGQWIVVDVPKQERIDREAADAEAAEKARMAERMATFPAQDAAFFRLLMRRNFGENAETNREITAEVVMGYFAGLTAKGVITAQQASDGVFLQQLFESLARWNGTGETWTLPWELLP